MPLSLALSPPSLRLSCLVAAAALLAGACGAGGSGGGYSGVTDISGARGIAALERFDSCDALLDHLRQEALARVGPYGIEGAFGSFEGLTLRGAEVFEAELAEDGDLSAAPATAGSSGRTDGATSGVSTTNNQVAGVDEADVVKTDGERMVTLTAGKLTVLDITGDAPVVIGSDLIPGDWGHELLVSGDRALVLSRGYGDGGPVYDFGDPTLDIARSTGAEVALLTEVDLAGDTGPHVVSTLTLPGTYLSARLVGDTARVVVSTAGPLLPFVVPSRGGADAERVAESANRALIEASTVADWLPGWTLEADGTTQGTPAGCDQVHQPAAFSGFGVLAVHTIDLGDPRAEPDPVAVLADGELVSATAESLYVATNRWVEPGAVPEEEFTAEAPATEIIPSDDVVAPPVENYRTDIHAFRLDAGTATYEASGSVRGHVLNQFSMDEHQGVLRVATTDGAPWGWEPDSESFVTTLERDGDRLVELGRVGGLGQGEEIQSVRFIGPTGYVVTFRQTDPLYVVDLADPTAPAVSGELKILGYSAYLHPLGDDRLIGVGQDADETGTTQGTQVSVFDVSDPSAPTRTAQHVLRGADSAVEFDHRAFLYWEPTDSAFVPVSQYDRGDYRQGLLALEVTPDAVEELDLLSSDPGTGESLRAVVVGDTLYDISTDAVPTFDLDTLDPRAQVAL